MNHSASGFNAFDFIAFGNDAGNAGIITEGNKIIVDDPSKVNTDPEGESWFFKIKLKDKSQFDSLMSKEDYEKFVKENQN